jgi:gamma-glutamylcyclotransferase (GGCT)/AIG2-like uncharacterized protein YtfP
MTPTELFVYGTLRHDQPEHAQHCRGVLGWRRARMRGGLWTILAGYRLLVVEANAVLLQATRDAEADEARRRELPMSALVHAASVASARGLRWVEGEVLTFGDAAEAWPPLDAWENSAPGEPALYPRVVVPVELMEGPDGETSLIAAWAYVASRAPLGATPLEE